MSTQRLEAFSDAVVAIIITILVLEFKIPHEPTIEALVPLWPIFLSYVISFLYLAIYWNNHHHMLHVTQRASGAVLWANMHLLFWLSLLPFVTAWLGENRFASKPAAIYGVVLLMAAIAYYVLEVCIIRHEGHQSKLKAMVGKDLKGKASIVLYVVGIGLAFVSNWAAVAVYSAVALMWLVPDRRIEKHAA
jgi:uncharacterized membrane protein